MANQTTQTIIVNAPIEKVYSTWANFENFPYFMENITEVTKVDDRMSHWKMKGPLGIAVEWDAETTALEENTRIAWNSRDSSTITTSGQVVFTKLNNNETQIMATINYTPPAGKLGEAVAELLSNPDEKLTTDLKNFKHYIEGQQSRSVNE